MAQKTTLVITAVPNPEGAGPMQTYLQKVMPLFVKAGGQPVKRLKVDQTLHGSPSGMVLVMDFDSAEAVTAMFDSPEYGELLPLREQGFSSLNVLLTQSM